MLLVTVSKKILLQNLCVGLNYEYTNEHRAHPHNKINSDSMHA
jgi:hypothetical protein